MIPTAFSFFLLSLIGDGRNVLLGAGAITLCLGGEILCYVVVLIVSTIRVPAALASSW